MLPCGHRNLSDTPSHIFSLENQVSPTGENQAVTIFSWYHGPCAPRDCFLLTCFLGTQSAPPSLVAAPPFCHWFAVILNSDSTVAPVPRAKFGGGGPCYYPGS